MQPAKSHEKLQQSLSLVTALLDRHRVLETMAHIQQGPKRDLLESLVHRQNLAELRQKLKELHPADLAYVLESLPPADRLLVWNQVEPEQASQVLLEASRPVRESLLEDMDRSRLLDLLRRMDADDLGYVADSVDADVLQEVYRSLDAGDQNWVRSSMAYPEDAVGHLMSPDVIAVREDRTLEEVLQDLRRRHELPPQTDALFVVDARNVLRGALPLKTLLVEEPGARAAEVMGSEPVAFTPDDQAGVVANAFQRYDLVSAPVVDERGKLVGRLTVDVVMDFLRGRAEVEALKRAGLQGDEDLFAPARVSARNRWLWLAVNLVTAFVASRVIGAFEATIERLVALATLMPIVASVGGNTGNQTVALVIRGLALGQISPASTGHLVRKELIISLMNGLVWGGIMGLFALALYGSVALGLVMAAAILLNLIVAALMGIATPLLLHRSGRDPAQGASVLLTFTTDGMGFFLFLGLARLFLV